jgi:hypothetical protein
VEQMMLKGLAVMLCFCFWGFLFDAREGGSVRFLELSLRLCCNGMRGAAFFDFAEFET